MKHIKKFSEDIEFAFDDESNGKSVTFYSINYNFKKEILLNQHFCSDSDNEYLEGEWESFDEYIYETKQNILGGYEQRLLSAVIIHNKEQLKSLDEQIKMILK
jgi:hypothetical protein